MHEEDDHDHDDAEEEERSGEDLMSHLVNCFFDDDDETKSSSDLNPLANPHHHAITATVNAVDNTSHSSNIQEVAARQTPNTQLNWEQRQAKRDLKRHLQRKMRIKTLENRIKQALKVNHDAIVQESQQALYELLQQEQDEQGERQSEENGHQHEVVTERLSSSMSSISLSFSPPLSIAQEFIIQLCTKLQEHQHTDHPHHKGNYERRQYQNEQSAKLLQHMTKGTQQINMFTNNEHALHGYTRQKFLERAMLLTKSIYRLQPQEEEEEEEEEAISITILPSGGDTTEEEEKRKRIFWNLTCHVRSVCSIACGPGCDAMGMVAFLLTQRQDHYHAHPLLERVLLFDWAIDPWKVILEPLQHMVVPRYVQRMEMGHCDIRQDLLRPKHPMDDITTTAISWTNQTALSLLMAPTATIVDGDDVHNGHGTQNPNKHNNQPQQDVLQGHDDFNYHDHHDVSSKMDMFIFSYVLTETREQWATFCQDLISLARPNALFYFAEPTAWQLHRLLLLFPMSQVDDEEKPQSPPSISNHNSNHNNNNSSKKNARMDWIWLDSSMDSPSLQCLERRVGPAVLLGRKLP